MENRHTATFRARLSALSEVERFVDDVCARCGIARAVRLKLSLVVEELFTNTVRHGFGKDTDEPIVLVIEPSSSGVSLTYEDTAPPHDPFTAPSAAADAAVNGEAKVGGIGLRLIVGMSSAAYRYADGKNRISLSIDAG